MYYFIKPNKINELKDGRTVKAISIILGLNYANLNLIFNGSKCKQILAMALISIKTNLPMNSIEMQELLNYYFYIK